MDHYLILNSYGLDTGSVEFFDNPINRTSHPQSEWVLVSEFAPSELRSKWDVESCSQDPVTSLANAFQSSETSSNWKLTKIAQLDSPVAVTVADVDGDGLDDLIICYNYGKDFIDCNPEGGYIAWLKNPGRSKLDRGVWDRHYIGRWPAMHRLKAGYFTQRFFRKLILVWLTTKNF